RFVCSPECGKLAIEISSLIGEFGRAEPVYRVRPGLLTDLQQLVADLVDRLIPRQADPLAVDELYRVAQASFAQHVIANRRTLAAVRTTVDRTVVVRLLADPHSIGDFGNHGTAHRA